MLPRPGNALRLTIDIDAPAGRREGAPRTGSRSRTRTASGPRTAARSSRSTRATARCSRSPRTRRTSRRSTSAAATRASSRRSRTRSRRREGQLPRRSTARSTSTYPPGSTLKPVTALAAMQEHVLSPYSPLLCSPTYTVKGETGASQTFHNWNPYVDQWIDLKTALAESCDTYFYQVGYSLLQPAAEPRSPAPELGLARSGSARRPGSTSAARRPASCRRRSGGGRHFAGSQYTAVDRTGCRATRSSSRSARATCS